VPDQRLLKHRPLAMYEKWDKYYGITAGCGLRASEQHGDAEPAKAVVRSAQTSTWR